MIPSESAVRRRLLALEEELNRAGWDQPPALYVLHGEDDNVGLYPLRLSFHNPGEYLQLMAERLRVGAPGRRLARSMVTPDFAGFVVTSESWQNHNGVSAAARAGRPLADIPGSVEARDVMAVDVAARRYWASRIRGKMPYEPLYAHGGIVEMAGRIPTALLSMCLSVARQMPPGTVDLDALRSDKLPDYRGPGQGT